MENTRGRGKTGPLKHPGGRGPSACTSKGPNKLGDGLTTLLRGYNSRVAKRAATQNLDKDTEPQQHDSEQPKSGNENVREQVKERTHRRCVNGNKSSDTTGISEESQAGVTGTTGMLWIGPKLWLASRGRGGHQWGPHSWRRTTPSPSDYGAGCT